MTIEKTILVLGYNSPQFKFFRSIGASPIPKLSAGSERTESHKITLHHPDQDFHFNIQETLHILNRNDCGSILYNKIKNADAICICTHGDDHSDYTETLHRYFGSKPVILFNCSTDRPITPNFNHVAIELQDCSQEHLVRLLTEQLVTPSELPAIKIHEPADAPTQSRAVVPPYKTATVLLSVHHVATSRPSSQSSMETASLYSGDEDHCVL